MNLFITFVLALLPIIWLVIALVGLKMKASLASWGALAVAFVEAVALWHMSFTNAALAALEGFAMAVWPIVMVIIAAIFTYNITVHTGAMEDIKAMITSVSNDKRVLVILIGWCFGGFMEGMAGYGTAIAIPASMLYALGFDPVVSILVCLIANACPTMFGAIGIPTSSLAASVSLDSLTLAFAQVVQVWPLLMLSPFLMILLFAKKGLKSFEGLVPFLLVAGLSIVIPEFIVAKFVGPDLPMVVGGVCALVACFAFALKFLPNEKTPEEFRVESTNDALSDLSVDKALVSWSPFILILVILLGTSKLVPFIYNPLSAIKSTFVIYPESTFTAQWIETPGVLVMIAGLIGARIQGCSLQDILSVLKATVKQMSQTILTMLGVVACAKIMGYAGMINDIATFFVTTLGSFFPFVSPFIGALGTFVTGSGTSSGLLFGGVQKQAATTIGADPYWLVAANSLGTSAGKMLAPQSIAIGCAACDLSGKDGEILGKIAKYALVFVILMALITYFGAGLWEVIK